MTTEKKTLLTNEEAINRVKAAVKESGWTGAAATIDYWLKESCVHEERGYRYFYFQGIIDSLAWSDIISLEERSQIINSLIENEF